MGPNEEGSSCLAATCFWDNRDGHLTEARTPDIALSINSLTA